MLTRRGSDIFRLHGGLGKSKKKWSAPTFFSVSQNVLFSSSYVSVIFLGVGGNQEIICVGCKKFSSFVWVFAM